MWDPNSMPGVARGVSCGEGDNTAMTHVINDEKSTVTLRWRPTDPSLGKVVFVASVVKKFDTFWVG